MNKTITGILVALIIVVGGYYVLHRSDSAPQQTTEAVADGAGPKNASYIINGQTVQLQNGITQTEAAPGSASMVVTRYFGNDLEVDLNGDGRMDDVFVLTQETGGSGTFYYAVAALNTAQGYIGSDGYLLGDRIAPQTIDKSQDPQQKGVVVVNYADRAPGEPMTAAPSVGKSVYLKLNPDTMQWGIVANNFEGESR